MARINPEVDALLDKTKEWREVSRKLREIILDYPLREDVKWGKPCYSFQGRNVVMIYGFKEDCVLGFFKGALLKDTGAILLKPGENSRAVRWVRFRNVPEIAKMEPVLKTYIQEAIELEKAGVKIDFQEDSRLARPAELEKVLTENSAFKTAFEALTPGRQRGYILYFSGAKQPQTRASRIEKSMPDIFNGKGLHDR